MTKNLCMSCMGEMEPGQTICPRCGQDGARLVQPDYVLPPGSKLHDGKYTVGRMLGQGGFGITYIGFDNALNMKVAVKEYYPRAMASRTTGSTSLYWQTTTAEQQAGRETFIKEARKMARINEIDGVARVQDIFYQNQTAYIIMNYIEGDTLKEYLEKHGVMKEAECVKILRPVMDALAQSHRAGMIHRDVSPDNIMIDKNGKVWLLDLGAAKELTSGQSAPNLSQSTHMVVKNGYSPPEQYTDAGKIGPWTDIYAVCATMYYCLTGNMLPDAPARAYQPEIAFPPSLSPAMTALLRRGLSIKPEGRWQSMEELEKALPDVTPTPSPIWNWLRTHKAASLAAVAAIVCAVIFLGVYGFASPVTIKTLGTTNSNMVNYGCWAVINDKYEYFIEGDNALYVCAFDEDDKTFYVDTAEKVSDNAGYLTIGGEYVYFLGTENHAVENIYCMNQDGTGIKSLISNTDGEGYQYLNYAKLSNGGEYLYFMRENAKGEGLSSLYRYNLKTKNSEAIVEGNVIWYNLYKDSIYYADYVSDTSSTVFKRCGLGGEAPETLVENKAFTSGIISDDLIYMYSYTDETFLAYNLDGTIKNVDGFYNLMMDPDYRFCCEDGWIYYTSKTDNEIHRVRVNGNNDSAIGSERNALAIYSGPRGIYVIEKRPAERPHRYEQQAWMMWLDNNGNVSRSLDIGEPELSWGLSEAYSFDFEWTEEDGGVMISSYKGNLTSFAIPEEIDGKPVVSIGEEAFQESEIREIGLPDTVTTIGDNAFYSCQNLFFVGLPDSLTEIGYAAFGNCPNLTEVDFPDHLTKINNLAFAESGLSSVLLPASLTEIDSVGAGAFAVRSSTGLKAFELKEGSPLNVIDGALFYEGDGYKVLLAYPSGKEDTSYTIPDETIGITGYAFAHCKNLTEVEIPRTVRLIKDGAFWGSGITEITVHRRCDLSDNLGVDDLTVKYYPDT